MSLFKQITLLLSLFILLVLGSVMYLNFKTANEFIQNQLYTTSEDTATSLGLSLSLEIPRDGKDLTTMQTMVNAIFDRGYYESIILKDMDGKVLIKNENILKVKTVPEWFIHFVKLTVPTAKTQISSGWSPYGILYVKLHSGHAYLQLWNTFIHILESFFIFAILALSALYFLLKIILKSLQGVEDQAKAVTNNQFIIQDKIPFTTEFKNVVIGMNKMILKVKDIFEHEALMVKKYNDLLYTDQESGIGNRKLFSLRLSSLLDAKNKQSSGTVSLFEMDHFSELKTVIGYEKLQKFVNLFIQTVNENTRQIEQSALARLKDYEFAVILPECEYEKTTDILNSILSVLNDNIKELSKEYQDFKVLIGTSYYDETDTQKDILSRCDFALAKAKMNPQTPIVFHSISQNNPLVQLGQENWHKLVTKALNEDGVKLALQPVKDIHDGIYHYESYLRLSDDKNNIYSAGLFMPILHTLNLTEVIDKKVFEIAFEFARTNPQMHIAINVDTNFIQNASNLYWLTNLLQKNQLKVSISFESNNNAILSNLEVYISFANLVRSLGYEFGIDNFSIQSQDLNYLQQINPDYIKADKSFFINMSEGANNSSESFKLLANSLDIRLIATAVETEEEYEILKAIPIDLLQGSYIAKPTL